MNQIKLRTAISQENKAVLRRHFEEISNQGNAALVDALFASDCFAHIPPSEIEGREAMKQYVWTLQTAFPDLRFTIEDVISEGDKAAARYSASTSNKHGFQRTLSIGTQGIVMGISIARVANGKLVEYWANGDILHLIRHERIYLSAQPDPPEAHSTSQ